MEVEHRRPERQVELVSCPLCSGEVTSIQAENEEVDPTMICVRCGSLFTQIGIDCLGGGQATSPFEDMEQR